MDRFHRMSEIQQGSDANLASVLPPSLVHLPEGALPDELDHMVILYPHLPRASQNPSSNQHLTLNQGGIEPKKEAQIRANLPKKSTKKLTDDRIGGT